jgi:hypothetical protein
MKVTNLLDGVIAKLLIKRWLTIPGSIPADDFPVS